MLWWWIDMQILVHRGFIQHCYRIGHGGGEGQAGRGAAGRASSLASLAAAEEADGVARVVGRRDGGGRADNRADNSPPDRRFACRDMEGPVGRSGPDAR